MVVRELDENSRATPFEVSFLTLRLVTEGGCGRDRGAVRRSKVAPSDCSFLSVAQSRLSCQSWQEMDARASPRSAATANATVTGGIRLETAAIA